MANLLGDRLDEDIPVEEMVRELETKYDTYFILPNLTSYYNDPKILRCWSELLGENVIRLENPEGISELIASTIGVAEGVVDLRALKPIFERRDAAMARVISRALASMGREVADWPGYPPSCAARYAPVPAPKVAVKRTPRWRWGFVYKSRRWHFVMRVVRALTRPLY